MGVDLNRNWPFHWGGVHKAKTLTKHCLNFAAIIMQQHCQKLQERCHKPILFSHPELGVEDDKCSDVYPGGEPLSDAESRNMFQFYNSLEPVPGVGHFWV